ncbi:MAG: alpha/beta hydrolase [Hyphomicrobiaceae bacterium]
MTTLAPLSASLLPSAVRARMVDNGNGLVMHVLEAGERRPGGRTLLLLHGFPELAYSWRKVMPALAAAGYHVIAPDQRGYGRTTGADMRYDTDLAPYRILNLVRDAMGLLAALGLRSVDCVVGHDFGSPVAAACALARPDVFRALVMMSAPFAGIPAWPAPNADGDGERLSAMTGLADPGLDDRLAALDPPRKHYQWFYSTRSADADMHACPQGIHAFLRAYYHMKSADWAANAPRPLGEWSAAALGELPTYYVMMKRDGMAETVAREMPSPETIAACGWLPDHELAVYAEEYGRTTFQGGLNWYRCVTGGLFGADLKTFMGRQITVPAAFVSGRQDWGNYQKPGDLEAMQATACADFRMLRFVDRAGHWVQQEQPEAVTAALLEFLSRTVA